MAHRLHTIIDYSLDVRRLEKKNIHSLESLKGKSGTFSLGLHSLGLFIPFKYLHELSP